MAQYQINVDSTILHQLLIGEGRDAGVAKLLESVLNQVLQAQVTEQLDAERYERVEERKGYRNGAYPHKLTTRVGTITLHIPRIRDGKFSTDLFARYQRSEQAFVLALMEMVVNGVSTRKVSQITEELCGAEFSKSTVSEWGTFFRELKQRGLREVQVGQGDVKDGVTRAPVRAVAQALGL